MKIQWLEENGSTPSQEWEGVWNQIPQSNLLQSFSYGSAKQMQGWKPIRGLLIEDETIGLVQVLMGYRLRTRIYRLNRGPLFLKPQSPERVKAWFQVIRNNLKGFGRGVFAFAPETLTSPGIPSLRFKDGLHSAWISLIEDEAKILASFDNKWRNMVSGAKRKSVVTQCYREENADRFFSSYEQHAIAKGYSRLDKDFLNIIMKNQNSIMYCEAKVNDAQVGGVLMFIHGTSATYLAGFTQKEAPSGTNNLLLWESICYLKKAGILWFDVGGISEEKTPGVTKFKRGMSGAEFKLSGEFFSWI
jgi:hypothetical protein